jgi:hypothetical protein
MKRDPEFAEQVREALAEAIANVEHVVYDRIHLPNRRPIYDRNGVLLGYDESWKDANTLALRFLEKHDATWVQRKQIDGTQTVIHTDAEMGSGAAYVVKPADLMLLPPESRLALLDLLQQIEDARDGTPALPGPVEGGTDGPE